MPQFWRRSIRWALLYETICAVAVLIFGFGAPFSFAPTAWYYAILPATQLPGIVLLRRLHLCCGYRSPLVISDVFLNRWGGLTPIGAPILFAANTFVVALLLAALFASRSRRPRRRIQPGRS